MLKGTLGKHEEKQAFPFAASWEVSVRQRYRGTCEGKMGTIIAISLRLLEGKAIAWTWKWKSMYCRVILCRNRRGTVITDGIELLSHPASQ